MRYIVLVTTNQRQQQCQGLDIVTLINYTLKVERNFRKQRNGV